jgi:hypothetical protein
MIKKIALALLVLVVLAVIFLPFVREKHMIRKAKNGDYSAMEWLVSHYTIGDNEYEKGAVWAQKLVDAGYENYREFCEWYADVSHSSTNVSRRGRPFRGSGQTQNTPPFR